MSLSKFNYSEQSDIYVYDFSAVTERYTGAGMFSCMALDLLLL